jgi:hypothetical protein
MSFFGEDDFSFLHNNYRDRSDDDDESDASSSDGEEDDEQSCTYVGAPPKVQSPSLIALATTRVVKARKIVMASHLAR